MLLIIAVLDRSKAFGRINHFKVYNSMLSTGIPVYVVNVICNWYIKLLASVRWNSLRALPLAAV